MSFLDLIFPKKCLGCGKDGQYLCPGCLAQVGPGRTSRFSISLFNYEGVIRKAIMALKYKFAYDIGNELAEACSRQIKKRGLGRSRVVLVPIPLHRKRQNWRGFNQAAEVGRVIAQKMNWKFEPDLLIRKLNVRPQVGLKGRIRHLNVREVFELKPGRILESNQTYLVFDDVATTGSTLLEAIKVLKKEKEIRAFGLTIAS